MEYRKDFDQWNEVKKDLDKKNQEAFFYEKEIWWCSAGLNVGMERNGKRLYKKMGKISDYLLVKIKKKVIAFVQ